MTWETLALPGNRIEAERVDSGSEVDRRGGPLRNLTAAWEDVQRTRLALQQRGIPGRSAVDMAAIEDRLARQIKRELERHPVWPWLSQFPGLGGVHTARVIALIDDPHRFPGRVCTAGHHHSAVDLRREIDRSGSCGYELADGSLCSAPVGDVRPGTGTRALWHYLGLHVVDGRSPRKRTGQRADWSPAGRTAVLQPGGIAEQIVRQRVPVYRAIYDATKERLLTTRGADACLESDPRSGSFNDQEEAVGLSASEAGSGLRPIQIEGIARKVAAKAFVADLLQAWKQA